MDLETRYALLLDSSLQEMARSAEYCRRLTHLQRLVCDLLDSLHETTSDNFYSAMTALRDYVAAECKK